MRRSLFLSATAALCALAAPAHASFHLIFVRQVYVNCINPNIQFVELVAFTGGQNLVNGHTVFLQNATGAQTGSSPCGHNVTDGSDQMRILFATTEAQQYFNITADFTMPASLTLAGGKVLWDNLDAFSFGNFSGPPGSGGSASGTPFASALGAQGYKKAPIRSTGANSTYEQADDHNDSALDFAFADVNVRNNAGVARGIPARTCSGDTNFDRIVNFTDLNNVLSNFGTAGLCLPGDVNDSGACDFADLNLVLSNFGAACPA